jgi:hypothetical protein
MKKANMLMVVSMLITSFYPHVSLLYLSFPRTIARMADVALWKTVPSHTSGSLKVDTSQ